MTMQPVSSSNIAAVGWEDDVLTVQFKNGGTYEYPGVGKGTYENLIAAPSVGKFFHANIRGGESRKK